MVMYIPEKKVEGDKSYRVNKSSFKIWIKNLRTNKISSTWVSNLRLVLVADLAYMNFDPYAYFGAQLKRLGNAGNNQNRGLSLLGGEDRIPDVIEDQDQPNEVPTQGLDTVVVDQADECTNTDTDPIGGATLDYDISLGARPKRVINKPKRFNDFKVFTGKLEPLFMAADMIQRSAIQAALKLHLSICDQNCCEHNMYQYLLE